jgi:hypothetical protein
MRLTTIHDRLEASAHDPEAATVNGRQPALLRAWVPKGQLGVPARVNPVDAVLTIDVSQSERDTSSRRGGTDASRMLR